MPFSIALRLLTAMALWASCFPLIAIGLGLAPHLAFAAMRAFLAGILLLLLAIVLRRPFPRSARSWGLILLVALGASTLGFLGMFHAAELVSPGLATVIYNVQPLIAAVLAHVFLSERLGAVGGAGLVVGMAGIVAIAAPGMAGGSSTTYELGIAYIALAAAGDAVGNVAMKSLPAEAKSDAIMTMGLQLAIGALPLALLSIELEDISATTWSAHFVVVLVALSVFGTALPFWLWFTSLKEVQLNKANGFRFLVPLFGVMLGVAFFREQFGWVQAAGAALILVGVGLVQFESKGRRGEA